MKTIRPLFVLCVAAAFLAGCRGEDPLAKFVTAVDVRSFNYVSTLFRHGTSVAETDEKPMPARVAGGIICGNVEFFVILPTENQKSTNIKK